MIDDLNEKYLLACTKVDQFVRENSKNWRVPQISDVIQIRCSNKPKLIAALRQNIEIDKSTISFFNSLKFLNTDLRERLTLCLSNLGLCVGEVADLPIGTGFFVFKNPSLPLFLIHQKFSSLFGYALMAESPISINRLEFVLDTSALLYRIFPWY